jgi:O-antigen/teichoic acid export membrane protein
MTPDKASNVVLASAADLAAADATLSEKSKRDRVSESMGTLARGAAINMVGTGSNIISRLIFNLLVARLLGASQLGVYFLALTVANVVGVCAIGGFDIALVRNLARHRTEGNWGLFRGTLRFAVRAVLALETFGTVILLVGAPWLSRVLFHKPEVAAPLRIVALYLPFFGIEMLLLAATQSFKEMKYKAYIESMLNPALRIVLVVLIWAMGGGLKAILISYDGVVALCSVLAYISLRQCLTVDLKAYSPTLDRRGLIEYSFPLFGVTILNFLIFYVDTLLLAHFRPSAEVGLYLVCIRLVLITGFALPVVSQIFAPMISELHHRGEIAEMGAYFKVVTAWAVQFIIPLMLLYVVAPGPVLGTFGKEFRTAVACLLILCVGQLVNILTGPVGLILNMGGWTRLQFWNSASVLVLQVTLAILIVPRYGYIGAAIANTSTVVVVNMARLIQLYSRLHIHPFSWLLGKPLAATAAALVLAIPTWVHHALISPVRLVLLWVGMVIAYIGTLYAFGLDSHSRLAWDHLRESLSQRFRPELFSIPDGKEAE